MFQINEVGIPNIGSGTLDVALTEEECSLQVNLEKFALGVMRPLAEKLDKMSAEEVCAEDSPIHAYFEQYDQLGLGVETLAAMSPEEASRILPIIVETLGYGDVGLGLLSLVRKFPAYVAAQMSAVTGDPEYVEKFANSFGCWVCTQPDRGTDFLDAEGHLLKPGHSHNKGNLNARLDGDYIILDGQSSAWVSGAPLANAGLVYAACDYGEGHVNQETGLVNGISLLVHFDEPGVSKGKPLEKMGQRSLPQGEIFFENVRIHKKFVVSDANSYLTGFHSSLVFANMDMGLALSGLARAAFEHAMNYVIERKQGGTAIINHQSVQKRVFDMWSKLEMSRAMSRRACSYNYLSGTPHVLASVTSKVNVTQMAFEIANEALQLFGANGLTHEYPIEKLFRDARAALIEDGENNVLAMKSACYLADFYKEKLL